jgi:hypothetical protein
MNGNLERLARTFRRPIVGIHNPSYGIPFDVIECIIQRTFAHPTLDIRSAYTTLSAYLANPEVKKLVLIAHSQGAIEAGMVLDWIYATLPRSQVAKLEIFTFGNAANHWNCPMDENGPIIRHIEHYANDGDWVARFGILYFRQLLSVTKKADPTNPALKDTAPQTPKTPMTPIQNINKQTTFDIENLRREKNRFVGRLFKRVGCSGHQLNQHYLDNLFVMDSSVTSVIEDSQSEVGIRDAANGYSGNSTTKTTNYMDMYIDQHMLQKDNLVIPIANAPQQGGRRAVSTRGGPKQIFQVKDLSRLWQFRNGRVPTTP